MILTSLLLAALGADSRATQPLLTANRLGVSIRAEIDGCPAPGAVLDQLLRLPLARPREAAPIAAQIIDQGETYRVEIEGGPSKRYHDPARRCEERTRTAALYVFLWLDGQPAPPPRALRPSAPRPRPPVHVDLEAAGAFTGGPAAGVSGGGGARVAVGGERFGGALGISAIAPLPLEIAGQPVSLLRLPMDLSARLALGRGRVSVLTEVGLLLALAVVSQPDGEGTSSEAGLMPGLRAAAALRVWLAPRLGLQGGATLEWTPRPPDVAFVSPAGAGGALPALWLGAAAGLVGRLR